MHASRLPGVLFGISLLAAMVVVLFGAVPAAYADHCPPSEEHIEVDGGYPACKNVRRTKTPVPPTFTFTPSPSAMPSPTHTATITPTGTPTPTDVPTPTPTATLNPGAEILNFDAVGWVQDKMPWFPNYPNTGNGLADELLTYPYLIFWGLMAAVVFVGWYSWKGKTWEDFWAWLKDLAPFIGQIFTAKFWNDLWKLTWDFIIKVLKYDRQWFTNQIWIPVSTWATNTWKSITDWSKGALNSTTNTADNAVKTVSNTAEKGVKTVSNTAEKAGQAVEDTAEDAGKSIEKGAKKAGKKIKKLFK